MAVLRLLLAVALATWFFWEAVGQPPADAPVQRGSRLDSLGDPLPGGAVARLGTTRFRHIAPITAVAVSPDGKRIATAAALGEPPAQVQVTVQVRDAETGVLQKSLDQHSDPIRHLAFSPGGKYLAGRGTGNIVVWDLATGTRLATPPHHEHEAPPVFSPDGEKLLYPSGDSVVVFDIPKLSTSQIAGHGGQIMAVRFTDGGARIEAVGWDGTRKLRDAATLKELRRSGESFRHNHHPGLPSAYSFAANRIAWHDDARKLHLDRDGEKDPPARPVPAAEDNVDTLRFSPDGALLAVGGNEWSASAPFLLLWDVEKEKVRCRLPGRYGDVKAIDFTPDGKTLVTGHPDGCVRFWDAATGAERNALPDAHTQKVLKIAYSADGKLLASVGADKLLCLWDVPNQKLLRRAECDDWLCDVAFSPDGKQIVTAGPGKVVRLWDAQTMKAARDLEGHEDYATEVAFAPDGKHLVSRGRDQVLRVWDLATGKVRHAIPDDNGAGEPKEAHPATRQTNPQQRQRASGLAFSPDGKAFAAASMSSDQGSVIRLYDLAAGKLLRQFAGGLQVNEIAFSPDGRSVAVADQTSSAHTIEASTFAYRAAFEGLTVVNLQGVPVQFGGMPGAGFGFGAGIGGGFQRVGGGFQFGGPGFGFQPFPVQYWPQSPRDADRVFGHMGPLWSARFSPRGKHLVTGGADGQVILWDAFNTKVLGKLSGHDGDVTAVAFDPDGGTFATAGADSTVLVWDLAECLAGVRADPRTWMDRRWAELAARGPEGFQAMQMMAEHPEDTLAFLREKLQPVTISPEEVRQLLRDLGSEKYPVRTRAFNRLEPIAEEIEPVLQAEGEKQVPLELHMRLKALLRRPEDGPSERRLRHARSVELLEHLATPGARELLRRLAGGTEQAWLTREARAALGRLGD